MLGSPVFPQHSQGISMWLSATMKLDPLHWQLGAQRRKAMAASPQGAQHHFQYCLLLQMFTGYPHLRGKGIDGCHWSATGALHNLQPSSMCYQVNSLMKWSVSGNEGVFILSQAQFSAPNINLFSTALRYRGQVHRDLCKSHIRWCKVYTMIEA